MTAPYLWHAFATNFKDLARLSTRWNFQFNFTVDVGDTSASTIDELGLRKANGAIVLGISNLNVDALLTKYQSLQHEKKKG